jgi:hypothetical protein
MKKLLLTALMMTFASAAIAGTRVDIKPSEEAENAARQAVYDKILHDHPRTEAIDNSKLKIAITTDRIMRSCCRPPDLVVSGRITNRSASAIDYIRLLFAFEDQDGKVLHAESIFNHRAESMSDDAEIQAILKEKPHFTPIAPGDTDTFTMSVPLPLLPKFAKVELYSSDMKP